MADLKTTAEERAKIRRYGLGAYYSLPSSCTERLLDDLDTLLAENAKLRSGRWGVGDLKQGWKIRVVGEPSGWLWVATLAEAEETMRAEVEEALHIGEAHPGFTVEVSTLDPEGIGEFDGWG